MKIKIPTWIVVFWIIVIPGLLFFLGRMIYECVYLTLKNGPQMIGFSLLHSHPSLYLFMILSYFATIIWIIVFIIWMLNVLKNKKRPESLWIFFLTISIVLFILFLEPISKMLS